ncbi:helix-turn-helix domain-containing protein [Apibacter raozihei]|uniref:helix-turn-helix domain-containing protein n=1 Tax=Apibacter raozihei TaxID=2500547 RepID=UPI000FE31310|nr:helix-turn-helix domain-containing protein [Apibacter raozihei]
MNGQDEKIHKITLSNYPVSNTETTIKNLLIPDNSFPVVIHQLYIVEGIIICICKEGRGKVKINMNEHEIVPDKIIFFMPGQVIEPLVWGENIKLQSLFFSIDFLLEFNPVFDIKTINKIRNIPCLSISKDIIHNLSDFHSLIVKYYEKNTHIFQEKIIKTILLAFLTELAGIYYSVEIEKNFVSIRKDELYNKFIQLLLKFHKKERSVGFYAEKMFLTPKYLSKIIKDISGVSATEWINRMVMITAKNLLKTSNLTVLQISEELNFPNPSFFSKFFKKNRGLSPIEYRKK